MLEAIVYKDGLLSILDQKQLPHVTHYEVIRSVEDGYYAIAEMKVRGAPAIAIVAALSLAVEIKKTTFDSKNALDLKVQKHINHLASSRPTAVNLKQLCEYVKERMKILLDDDNVDLDGMHKSLILGLENYLEADITTNMAIGENGGQWIQAACDGSDLTILTHCNTGSLATAGYGTALGVIRWLYNQKILNSVYCTETRPYNQGARLTAYELLYDKIPATLICDSMVAALMKIKNISAVIVGADRVVANGDTANKIGTYQIAVCAKHHGIPFYVACSRSTLDFSLENGNQIPIEHRPSSEMISINNLPIAPTGMPCWNPAFDITPAELITGGIITECGVFPASALRDNQKILSCPDFLEGVFT